MVSYPPAGGSIPPCGIALTHSSALSVFFYQYRLEGPRWALRFNIMSQRKKGCESLTYPFSGFNFYQRQYTCQDNVTGFARQRGSMAERFKAPAGSNPAASVESSAIHSLVFQSI